MYSITSDTPETAQKSRKFGPTRASARDLFNSQGYQLRQAHKPLPSLRRPPHRAVGLDAGQVIRWRSWHRWTAVCLLAYLYLAVAVALQREQDVGSDPDAGLIPVTILELLPLLRVTVIPPPRRDRAHRLHWPEWRRRHRHRARQAHQRRNAYAETTPRSQRTTAAVTYSGM